MKQELSYCVRGVMCRTLSLDSFRVRALASLLLITTTGSVVAQMVGNAKDPAWMDQHVRALPKERNPKAEQILERTAIALGGKEAIRNIPGWLVEGSEISSPSNVKHYARWEASGEEFRVEYRFGSQAHSPAKVITSGTGQAASKSPTAAKGIPPHVVGAWLFPPFLAKTVQKELADPLYTIAFAGEDPDTGDLIIQTFSHSSQLAELITPQLWYLDKTSFLPRKIIIHAYDHTNANRYLLTTFVFDDYRSVQGIQIPFHITQYVGSSLVTTTDLSSAELQKPIDATRFKQPEGDVLR